MEPPLQALRNTINSQFAFKYPDAGTLASGVAQGQVGEKDARLWASYSGIGDDAFTALRDIADTGPPLAPALTLLRRGVWLPDQYKTALKRQAIEDVWVKGLLTLQDEWLTPDEIAVMVQRSVLANPDLLPNQPSTEGSNVPPMPQVGINPIDEAAGAGISRERLAAKTRIIGLPASPDLAARLTFRKIITEGAFNQAILEGNTRGEWAPFLLEGFRQILTANEYAELNLRGWITDTERNAGAALHGMSAEDAELLWKLHGRPLAVHQITTGLARGGKFHPLPGAIQDPYQAAVRLSSVRPEYYDLDIANKYTLPSPFVMRQLTTSKVWSEAKAAERLKWAGWIPEDADEAAKAWATQTSGATKEATATDLLTLYDGRHATHAATLAALQALGYPADEAATKVDVIDARRVVGAKQAAIGDLHTKYKKGELSNAAVETALTSLGVAAWARPEIVAAWQTYLTAEQGAPPA